MQPMREPAQLLEGQYKLVQGVGDLLPRPAAGGRAPAAAQGHPQLPEPSSGTLGAAHPRPRAPPPPRAELAPPGAGDAPAACVLRRVPPGFADARLRAPPREPAPRPGAGRWRPGAAPGAPPPE